MSDGICNCHVNGFSHWKFLNLRDKYDLGIKPHFDRGAAEPRLVLYVSVRQVFNGVSNYIGRVPIVLSRKRWSQEKKIDAVQSATDLQNGHQNMSSPAVDFLVAIAESVMPDLLVDLENSGTLNQNDILA